MPHRLLRILAWLLLAAIAFATLSPIGLRPDSGFSPNYERFAAFAAVGMMFVLAYPRHIWLVLALFACVLAAWYVVVTNLAVPPLAELGLLAIWYVLAFNFAATTLFVFPYLASFEAGTRQVLRNARLMSWKHPLTTFGGLALIGLAVLVTVFYPQFTAYGLAWLLLGFAGIAVLNGFLFTRVFSTYIAAAGLAQHDT